MLLAHARAGAPDPVQAGKAGLRAAGSALVELATGAAMVRFDDQEAELGPPCSGRPRTWLTPG